MKVRSFFPAISFGILIFVFASLPSVQLFRHKNLSIFFKILFSDSSQHFFAFAIFTALLYYGFYKVKNMSILFLKVGLYSISYGIFIELHQLLLGYRSFSFSDLFFDMAGIAFFLILAITFISLKNTSKYFSKI
jgi:hypothetical protein